MAAGLGQGTGRSSCLMMHVKWVVLITLRRRRAVTLAVGQSYVLIWGIRFI